MLCCELNLETVEIELVLHVESAFIVVTPVDSSKVDGLLILRKKSVETELSMF